MIIKKIIHNIQYPNSLTEYVALTAFRRYKVYKIPKRNGKGFRTIAQPTKLVKTIQREIVNNFLAKFPIHPCATAYIQESNILKNTTPHLKNKFLLKMDFSNFFNNISSSDFLEYINENGIKEKYDLDNEDINFLINSLFWLPKGNKNKILSIGAPSSPILSNILLFNFDEKIHKYCQSKSIVYTRYADDLAFSCNQKNILNDVETFVQELSSNIKSPHLIINQDKTIHSSKKHNRHLTGITITNEAYPSLGHKRKIILKSLIHKFINKQLNRDEINYLSGMLNFANLVDLPFIERMKNKYGVETIYKIKNIQHARK